MSVDLFWIKAADARASKSWLYRKFVFGGALVDFVWRRQARANQRTLAFAYRQQQQQQQNTRPSG